jgi:YVTN family beta-propeller protein
MLRASAPPEAETARLSRRRCSMSTESGVALTTPPPARIVLVYVERYTSPESFLESRFCLSRPFLFFGAVHEYTPAQSSWTQKEIAMQTSRTIEKLLHHSAACGSNGVWANAPSVLIMRNVLKLALMASCLLITSTLVLAGDQPIYDSWNADGVSNNPSIDPTITISSSSKISKIGDYHYNNGSGQDPAAINGKISIYDNASGTLIGSWAASTLENTDDLGFTCLGPNMCWGAYPNVTLKPGTYRIVDSDPSTWSYSTTNTFPRGTDWAPFKGFSYVLASSAQAKHFAYVTNSSSSSVSVVDTASNTVVATIGVGNRPIGVAFTPNGSRVYVANSGSDSVSVIDTATNTVIANVAVGSFPQGLAITPNGSHVYVVDTNSNSLSVIETRTNTVIATVEVGMGPEGIAITPDGARVYVANFGSGAVSVIDTATNTVVATIALVNSFGVAITPDGSHAYVTNLLSSSVSVIDTATNTVIATIKNVFQPVSVAITPDGTRAYVTNSSATFGSVSAIDTATNTVVATVGVGPDTQGLAITPDGTRVYVASFGANSVFVIDTATNAVTSMVAVGAAPVGVAIAPSSLTTLTSSLNPSIYGQKVTFTATVAPAGIITPTGKVNFTWSRFTIGSATLNSSGVAMLTKSNLNADSYPLTAVYRGDANNPPSTSAVLNQVVLETTSTATLTSSPDPSALGQAVTFIATITSPTVTPTGPVTFSVGKTVLGTAQLSAGKAKFTTSTLAVGSTRVTATYYGDSNIAKSSASVTQTVR